MRVIKLGKSKLEVPVIAVGCMRINSLKKEEAEVFLKECLEQGANFFDHADIYGQGRCEEVFSEAISMNSSIREKMIIQSKCGICPKIKYDFSKKHILESVDGSLKRLKTEYLDILLLHRPDALMEPQEVAEAFEILEKTGKVRYFGVSNHKPMQIELLQKYIKQDILVDQLQLSIPFSNMIANGLEVNMTTSGAVDYDGSILDYCRLHEITIQAWSPFQANKAEGLFLENEKYKILNQVLLEIAQKYKVTKTTITAAWILRHPAKIQMIAGTTNKDRLKEILKATEIKLTREEWYQIYLAAGHILP